MIEDIEKKKKSGYSVRAPPRKVTNLAYCITCTVNQVHILVPYELHFNIIPHLHLDLPSSFFPVSFANTCCRQYFCSIMVMRIYCCRANDRNCTQTGLCFQCESQTAIVFTVAHVSTGYKWSRILGIQHKWQKTTLTKRNASPYEADINHE